MTDEIFQRDCWGGTPNLTAQIAGNTRQAEFKPMLCQKLALFLGLIYATGVAAQTTDDVFDVTVGVSESQQQVVTQGATSLDGASIGLLTLERISAFSRARLLSARNKKKSSKKVVSRNIMLAALGNTLYSGLAEDTESTEVGLDFSRMGTFGDITYGFGDHNSTSNTPAYDTDIVSITAGMDYRLSPVAVLGGAVAYSDSGNNFSRDIGSLDIDSYSVAGFGSWYWSETGYVDAILRYARNDYDSRRGDTVGGVASGDTSGDEISMSIGGGYDYTLRGWTAGPTARINYTDLSIDGYREQNSAQAIAYEKQNVNSLNTNIGAQASRAINTGFGVILPQGNLEWVHEFEDDGRGIRARGAAGGNWFTLPVDARDSDYLRLSLGASLLFANGHMMFMRYESDVSRENVEQHRLSLGARLEF